MEENNEIKKDKVLLVVFSIVAVLFFIAGYIASEINNHSNIQKIKISINEPKSALLYSNQPEIIYCEEKYFLTKTMENETICLKLILP